MSLVALSWVAHLSLDDVDGTPRAVLTILADRSNDPGYAAFPAVATIASTLGCSTRTVQRAFAKLEAAGLIRRGDQHAVRNFRGGRRPTVWDVLTPALTAREARAAAYPGIHFNHRNT